MPTFNYLQQAKKDILAKHAIAQSAESFSDFSTLAALDQSFKIAFITTNSDLNSSDLVGLVRDDMASINDVLQYAVQVPMRMKLPMTLIVHEVMRSFLQERALFLGNRLSAFKANGGIKGGKLSFNGAVGSYKLEFDNTHVLIKVVHRNGDTADVDPKLNISKNYNLQDNFDDWSAHLSLPPLPPIKLSSFFEARSRTGPYKVATFHGRHKELARRADELYAEWQAQCKTKASQTKPSEEVTQAIKRQRTEKQRETMSRARASAQEALVARKSERAIALA